MPRKNRQGELLARIDEVGVFRDAAGGGSSTVAGAPPAADSYAALTVASATNFLAGDWMRVGPTDDADVNRIESVAGADLTPRFPHFRLRAVGDPVVELTQVNFGGIDRNGAAVRSTMGMEEVVDATRRLSIGHLLQNLQIVVSFSVNGFSAENIAAALGMLDTSANITPGALTAADPERMAILGDKVTEQADLAWYVNGTRKDGRFIGFQFWGVQVDYTQVRHALARGRAAPVPFTLKPTVAMRIYEID